jgi:hypothetical protein
VNHARRDLCGGCAAMRIPTAIGTGVVSQSIFPPWPRFNERIALI